MRIRTLFTIPRIIASLAVTAFLLASAVAGAAVGIGEATLLSKPGEPLLLRVELQGERVEDACLSLLPADPLRDDISSFLGEAGLSVRTEGARQYAEIS